MPGEIISEHRARSNRNAERHHRRFAGDFPRNPQARVNKTSISRKGTTAQCPGRTPGLLTIVQGRARYTSDSGYRLRGAVGPQGELAMRASGPSGSQPIEIRVSGRIDDTGTVRARQTSNSCSYDFVWRK
jgi:hypothetical protein